MIVKNIKAYVADPEIQLSKCDDLEEDFTLALIKIYGYKILHPEFCKDINSKLKSIPNLDPKISFDYIMKLILTFDEFKNNPIMWDNIFKYRSKPIIFNPYNVDKIERESCVRALDNYVILNEEVENLKHQLMEKDNVIRNLNQELEHLKFMPGGDGYYQTKEHFDHIAKSI
jgi:hypothetical protein